MKLHDSRGELVGSEIEVVDASNRSLIGIKGEVVDETRNTIRIKRGDVEKTLLKEQVTIKIRDTEIIGQALVGRPEERIKMTAKRLNRLVKKHAREK
ncbi:MAG: ribonuclease P protein component 1 [Candidatus Nanoarchaeia archaeon]